MLSLRLLGLIGAGLLFAIAGQAAGSYWQIDSSFAPVLEQSGDSTVVAGAVPLPDGSALVSTSASYVDGVPVSGYVHLKANGSVDTSFAPTITIQAVLNIFSDGRTMVTGNAPGSNATNLYLLSATGALDPSFTAPPLNGSVAGVEVQPDGRYLVFGAITSIGGNRAAGVVRLNADGSWDSSFQSALQFGPSTGVVGYGQLQPDGKLVIGGNFLIPGSSVAVGIARLNSNGSLDSSFATTAAQNGGTPSFLDLLSSGQLLTGFGNNIIRLLANGQTDLSFTSPLPSNAQSEWYSTSDRRIYYTIFGTGGVTSLNRLNIDGTVDTAFAAQAPSGVSIGQPSSWDGSIVYVASAITAARYNGRNILSQLSSTGTLNAAYAPRFSRPSTLADVVRTADGKYLVAGSFDYANGTHYAGNGNFVRLNPNGSLDSSFVPVLSSTDYVSGIFPQPDGHITVAGSFSTGPTNVRRYDADGSIDSTLSPLPVNASVLTADSAGNIYYEGSNGILARALPSGAVDAAFASTVGVTTFYGPPVRPLVNGKILVMNGFSQPYSLVRLNSDGSVDASFVSHASYNNGDVEGWAALQDGSVLVASASGEPLHLTHYNAAGTSDYVDDIADNSPGTPDLFSVSGVLFDQLLATGTTSSRFAGRTLLVTVTSAGEATTGYLERLQRTALTSPSVETSPTFYSQPTSTVVNVGALAIIAELPLGLEPFTYQWYFDGMALEGATNPFLTISNASAADVGTYTVTVTNAAGSITSAPATLSVGSTLAAPAVTTQPAAQSVNAGTTVSLSVAATGTAPLSYQWYDGSSAVAGATSTTLTLLAVTPALAGNYTVVVSGPGGNTTSANAAIVVASPAPPPSSGPIITTQPTGQTVAVGGIVNLSVAATGTSLSYQWYLNGNPIPGATSASLVVPNEPRNGSGSYTVTVTNPTGATTSSAAAVTVQSSRLVNISTRAFVGSGNQAVAAGYSVAGTGVKTVLVRGVGPALTAFGVTGALADPVLEWYDASSKLIGSDAGWMQSAQLGTSTLGTVAFATSAAFTSVGAFALAPNTPDSAFLASGQAGAVYTAQVRGASGDGGITLIEVYDTDLSAAPASRLVNLSSRAFVSAGIQNLAGGFAIAGPVNETLVIRAVGPTLEQLGVTGTLAAPRLMLFDQQSRPIATNAGWNSPIATGTSPVQATLRAATATDFTQVGAFPLSANSPDCAIVVTLPPGVYSAQVDGPSGTGIALFEVYELQ